MSANLTFYRAFQNSLQILHARREKGATRPWLKMSDVPLKQQSCSKGLAEVIAVMNGTRMGHLDRYEDRVSREVLTAIGRKRSLSERVAVAAGVRFLQSPRGLASKLAAASPQAVCILQ